MTQDVLLLLALAVIGVAAVGWTRRLAPALSEMPAKTLVAAVAAGGVVAATLGGVVVPLPLRAAALVAALAWVLVPLLLPTLARAGLWRWADALVAALWWTEPGRDGARRLLVQTALQRGEGDAALARLPRVEGEAMAAQAHALRGDWPAVLEVDLPPGRAGTLGRLAQVEAWLEMGRPEEAAALAASLRRDVETGPPDPVAYRAMVLAEVRLDAEAGNLRRVQDALRAPPVGVPQEVWLGLVARAAEMAGEGEAALRMHAEAYRVAAPARRAPHRRALEAAGRPLPTPLRAAGRARATTAAVAVIALAFVGQTLLDGAAGPFVIGGIGVAASSIAGAFVIGIPGLPLADAWWRHLAYAFVHGNLVHVGFNLWVLFDLGRLVEARRGPGYLVAAFALGTAMGAYLTSVAQSGGPLLLVGASGGVLGVAGALLADVSRRSHEGDRQLLGSLLQWMALIAFISLAIPNVSWWGHAGGVVGGLLWGFLRQGLPGDRRIDVAAGVIGAAALLWALGQAVRVALVLI
jgi:membrane associated rhomboid family serine protease